MLILVVAAAGGFFGELLQLAGIVLTLVALGALAGFSSGGHYEAQRQYF